MDIPVNNNSWNIAIENKDPPLTPDHIVMPNGHASYLKADDFMRINVCGMVYETFKTTVEKYPNTLLGSVERRQPYFVEFKDAYFFDRHRESFESVLYFYQSGGSLVRPAHVSMKLFAEEVRFFGIPEAKLIELQIMEGYLQDGDDDQLELPDNPWQRKMWVLMENPDSSCLARIIACFSILVIVVSITTFCLESIPEYNGNHQHGSPKPTNRTNATVSDFDTASFRQAMNIVETIAITWFTLEYAVRFLSSPNKWKFFKSFLNLIDLAAILPYYVMLAIESKKGSSLAVIRVARLVRVFRVFKLSRHSMGLQTLGSTLRASISELGMLVFIMAFSVLVFSSGMYYAEHDVNGELFQSIPHTFWYTVVTMTTVGYGDRVPVTAVGKFVGSVCAISGVLTIAMVVPIIITNFEFFYKRDLINTTHQRVQKKEGEEGQEGGREDGQEDQEEGELRNGSCEMKLIKSAS